MRQQLVEGMARVLVDSRQRVAQVGPGVQAIELSRLHGMSMLLPSRLGEPVRRLRSVTAGQDLKEAIQR